MVRCPEIDDSPRDIPPKSPRIDATSVENTRESRKGMCPDIQALQSTEEEHRRLAMLRDHELEQVRKDQEEQKRQELWKKIDGNRLLANDRLWRTLKWGVGIVVSIWVFSQLVSLVSIVNGSAGVMRNVALAAVVAILVACVWFAVLFCRVFHSLPHIKPSMKMKDGTVDREDVLRTYVMKLAGNFAVEGSYAKLVSDEAERCLKDLLEKDFGGKTDSWVARFEALQCEQIKRANERVAIYAKMVGVGTATCPWKAGDVFIVFCNSISMVVDIARIFNRLDVNRYVAFKFIRGWLSQMYIAGNLQDVSEIAATKVSADILGTFAEPLKKVMGKMSEGVVNGLLCYRFGKMAIMEFKQLRSQSEFQE